MAKKESTLLQLVLSLTLITLIAGVALASVYSITKEPITKSKEDKKNKAIAAVLTGFDAEKGTQKVVRYLREGDTDSLTLYLAFIDDNLFGAAVETYTDKAFSGKFSIMVGFDANGKILGTSVLSHTETPGLGDKINKEKDPKFSTQFVGFEPEKQKLQVTKDGGDVVAITAATISSRAFCDAIDRAYAAFLAVKNNPQFVNTPNNTDNFEKEASNE